MSEASDGRARQLDAALDRAGLVHGLAGELFGAVDAIAGASALKRAFSDPGAPAQAKVDLINRLFGGRVSEQALVVLREAVSLRWSSSGAQLGALERQAVRAELKQAQADGVLDGVLDDLFRFGRTVAGHDDLREALTGRRGSVQDKQALVERLLAGKANPVSVALARRAVANSPRGFAAALESFSAAGAQLRERRVAKVTAATPLSDDQQERLRAALAKQVGHDVDLQIQIDPSVLGGLRVQIGDDVIEGTVARRLDDARRQLA